MNLIDHNYFGNGKDLATGELKAKIEVLGFSEKDADELVDTTTQVRNTVMELLKLIEDKVGMMTGDLIEPMDTYIEHHELVSRTQLDKASHLFHNYHEQ